MVICPFLLTHLFFLRHWLYSLYTFSGAKNSTPFINESLRQDAGIKKGLPHCIQTLLHSESIWRKRKNKNRPNENAEMMKFIYSGWHYRHHLSSWCIGCTVSLVWMVFTLVNGGGIDEFAFDPVQFDLNSHMGSCNAVNMCHIIWLLTFNGARASGNWFH